ncbi:MAG: DNA-3-methyladenine glycosylase [Acidobacteria bacterium]|nr:DNA-3-methyladenine glycosylase [Acidobacteriota bacterium]
MTVRYERYEPLPRAFYQRPTVDVAHDLLGKLVVRRTAEGVTVVRLTEVEAYLGTGDRACHTFGGRRTPRTEVMWGEAGCAYIYFVYGMYHCLNVVTVGEGAPEAVLVRGGVPVVGKALMVARRGGRARALTDGPGKLCQAMALTREQNGVDLCAAGGGLWISSDGIQVAEAEVRRLPRIGVAYAGEAAAWPLRFLWRPSAPAPQR